MPQYVHLDDYWDASLDQFRALLGNLDNQFVESDQYELARQNPAQYQKRIDDVLIIRYRLLATDKYLEMNMFDSLTKKVISSSGFQLITSGNISLKDLMDRMKVTF